MTDLAKPVSSWRYALTDLAGLTFAALWGYRGLSVTGLDGLQCLALIAVPTLPLAYGFLSRDLVAHDPEYTFDPALSKHIRRMRILALFVIGFILNAIHRPEFMLVAAGLVIGASYIPLGLAMREFWHMVTGGGIIVITLATLAFSQPFHTLIAGLGTALFFWIGAVGRLFFRMPFSYLRKTHG